MTTGMNEDDGEDLISVYDEETSRTYEITEKRSDRYLVLNSGHRQHLVCLPIESVQNDLISSPGKERHVKNYQYLDRKAVRCICSLQPPSTVTDEGTGTFWIRDSRLQANHFFFLPHLLIS